MGNLHCAAPWRGLHINLDGDIRVCCAGRPGSFGNINKDSLECLTDSAYLKNIRQSMVDGQLHPDYCAACIENIKDDERSWFNATHLDLFADDLDVDEHHEFQSIDIRWNNTCNLACVYCSPYFSSTWAKREKISVGGSLVRHYDRVVNEIIQRSSQIKTVMLLGGEPLLIPQNLRLLEALRPEVKIVIITNLSVDLAENKIFQALKHFPHVDWCVSMENIEERFEFVRRGASWNMLLKNLSVIRDMRPQHTVGILAIYHVFNCTRLREFQMFADDLQIHVSWNTVSQRFLDPRWQSCSIRARARNEIELLLAQEHRSIGTKAFFRQVLADLLLNPYDPSITATLDDVIGKNRLWFETLWPEFVRTVS